MKRLIASILVFLTACSLAASAPLHTDVSGIVYLSDFSSLQEAVNAAPNGGTVIVPVGIHEVGNVVINQNAEWQKVVTISGIAPGHLGQHPPRGDSQWEYLLNNGYYYGSILRGTISMENGARLYLRDLVMIGYGSEIAIDYGNNVNMFPHGAIQNVAIGNYDIGIRLRKAYYMSLADLNIAGVGTGIETVSSNVINLSSIDIISCDLGVQLGGNGNSWIGGSVQACNNGVKLGGYSNVLGGVYFEQIASKSIELTGQGWSVLSNFYATNSGQFLISGKSNDVVLGVNPIAPIELTSTAMYNYVRGSAYLVCNDAGFRNRCERLWP